MSIAARGAIVTGAGRGIGAAAALALARQGVRVVVGARTGDEIEGVAEGLRADGGEAWAVRCDVSDPASVQAMHEKAVEHLGAVDILVNNAGAASSAPVAEVDLAEWNRLLSVNATGALLAMQRVLPGMIERGWGRVVNVASTAALQGARYIAAYSASKHALLGLTRSAAAEVAATGVTVNAVCPGYTDTLMTRGAVDLVAKLTDKSHADALAGILAAANQHRLIAPEEVAASVTFLCGRDAGGVNGQAIVVDGGASA